MYTFIYFYNNDKMIDSEQSAGDSYWCVLRTTFQTEISLPIVNFSDGIR